MPGYDVLKGLAGATPMIYLLGASIVILVGALIGRRKKD